MIPKSLPADLIRGWIPVSRLREALLSRLREALPIAIPDVRRYGGRRQVGKDHAQTTR
jgi:hypothetical protein